MYKSIVVAVALFNQGATSRALIQKANKLIDPDGTLTLIHVLDEVPAYLAAAVEKEKLLAHRKAIREQLESLASSARPSGSISTFAAAARRKISWPAPRNAMPT